MTWTVDYGEGTMLAEMPHAWQQNAPVAWEGPAVYRTEIDIQHDDEWLVFDGASYQSLVYLNGQLVCDHRGIWDSFAVPLAGYFGSSVKVEVYVTKNGGATFPVKDVLSGFIPFVYHTFGGLYGGARIERSQTDPTSIYKDAPANRVTVEGSKIQIDGKPFYMRGVLSWGWYPELGHMNPSDEEIRSEVRLVKKLGFNTIKFCLWVPRHRFFEILEEEKMFAWLELPLWDPTDNADRQDAMERETEIIVKQFRHHRAIIAWTVGCELSTSTDHEFRKRLVEMVQRETGCPLVKDNSGSAEMYGGDLREYGTFDDFHPYCDTHFYPAVLDTLKTAPRESKPILLGEFNDFDIHRDLQELKENDPYWISNKSDLNDQGVRWQHDMPTILRSSRWTQTDNTTLAKESKKKGAYVRRKVMEHVRSMDDVAGYVITGWRHTPISTSGMVDDDLNQVFDQQTMNNWNSDDMMFLIPSRRPPWIHGGNRPGWLDTQCFFTGQVFIRVGAHVSSDTESEITWELAGETGQSQFQITANNPQEFAQISVDINEPGEHVLKCGDTTEWPIHVIEKTDWSQYKDWKKRDQLGLLDDVDLPGGTNILTTSLDQEIIQKAKDGATVVALLTNEGTVPMPFWRECAFEFETNLIDDNYEKLWGLATDRCINPDWLKKHVGSFKTQMNRIDTRTYKEHAYIAIAEMGKGKILITTLRPYGAQGCQPWGVNRNPSGSEFLKRVLNGKW